VTIIRCSDANCPDHNPVLGHVEGGAPWAAWGYLCDASHAQWKKRMDANPDARPRTLLTLLPRPLP
jgi:hypothetical protein